MTKVKQLEKFIKENKLEFNSGSGGDVNILALCGYACYIDADMDECVEASKTIDCTVEDEIIRVWVYADNNNYANFWDTQQAKEEYKF